MAELVVAVLVLIWLVAVLDNVVAGGRGDDVAVAEVLGKVELAGGGDDDEALTELLVNTGLVGREDVNGGGDDEAGGVDEAGDIQAASQ